MLIGDYGINRADMLSGERDPDNIEGNSKKILKDAELVFSIEEEGRLGPPIYIFKVTQFSLD